MSVNLTGTFIASQIVSSDMIRKRAGSIINMTSIVVHGQVNYSASKAGLIGFTKNLEKETAGRMEPVEYRLCRPKHIMEAGYLHKERSVLYSIDTHSALSIIF